MRITQVILSKHLGGAERHVADLSNFLARNHDVQVILRRPARRREQASHAGNIAPLLNSGIEVREVSRFLRDRQISRLIGDFRPDVIHTHLGDAGKSLRSIRPAIPLVGTLHGEYKDKCYRAHDALICVAGRQRHAIPRDFQGKVVTIPNFLSCRRPVERGEIDALRTKLGIAPDAFIIGSVGRLAPEKGFDILLNAFRQANLQNSVLVLVGDGPERKQLESMEFGGVNFAGWQSDPAPFYSLFDLFIMPSRAESFGIALLEAMQAGTPIISTRTDGPAELLQGGAGILVDIDDISAMAAALRRLASAPELREELAKSGRMRAEDYRIEAIVPRIESLYREIIG